MTPTTKLQLTTIYCITIFLTGLILGLMFPVKQYFKELQFTNTEQLRILNELKDDNAYFNCWKITNSTTTPAFKNCLYN